MAITTRIDAIPQEIPSPFESIPQEVCWLIYSFLNTRKVFEIRTVCKTWNGLLSEHPLECLRNRVLPKSLPGFPVDVPFTTYVSDMPLNKAEKHVRGDPTNHWIESYMVRSNPEFLSNNLWLTSFQVERLWESEQKQLFSEALGILRERQVSVYIPQKHLHLISSKIRLPQIVLNEALRHRLIDLMQIIPEAHDEGLRISYVRSFPEGIKKIPDEAKTRAVWLAAFQGGCSADQFNSMSEVLKADDEVCLKILKVNGMILKFIPEPRRSKMFCVAAVSQDPNAFPYVPSIIIRESGALNEICLAGLKNGKEASRWLLQRVPESERTDEMYLLAVTCSHLALPIVPPQKRTDDHYKISAGQVGGLSSIPESARKPEFYLIAGRTDGLILKRIADKNLTVELCYTCVDQNSAASAFVPPRMVSEVKQMLNKKGKDIVWRSFIPREQRKCEDQIGL